MSERDPERENRIRVLHVSTSFASHDGLSETVRLLCRKLAPEKFRLGLCSITDREEDVLQVFRELPVKLYALHRRGYFFDPSSTLALARVIRDFRANVVHTHNNKGNLHGRLAARVGSHAAIVTTHHDAGDVICSRTPSSGQSHRVLPEDVHDTRRPTFVESRVYPFLNVALNRLNAKVITVSDAVGRIHTRDRHDPRFQTVYAPYDEEIFQPRYKGRRGDAVVLGTVGRLSRVKGHATLLDAVERLVRSRGDLELRIIGEGPLRSEIERSIREKGLGSVVELLGHRPHDHRLYDGMDIYLQPSLSEGCSITCLEAMASGLPVIASDVEGPAELILDRETGLLVPPGDPQALTAAIRDLIDDPDRARRLGRRGSERARENFTATIFAEKMARIYGDLRRVAPVGRRNVDVRGV